MLGACNAQLTDKVRCILPQGHEGNHQSYTNDDSGITTGKTIDPEGVNHPSHYNKHPSGVECIEIVRHHNFNIGSTIKYLWRQGLKEGEPSIKDLKKALFYLKDEIQSLEGFKQPQACEYPRGANGDICGRPLNHEGEHGSWVRI